MVEKQANGSARPYRVKSALLITIPSKQDNLGTVFYNVTLTKEFDESRATITLPKRYSNFFDLNADLQA